MKKTQEQRVIEMLLQNHCVTRNWCLSSFPAITRLGAIIASLKQQGWEFDAGYTDQKDYVYNVLKKPDPSQKTIFTR